MEDRQILELLRNYIFARKAMLSAWKSLSDQEEGMEIAIANMVDDLEMILQGQEP